MTDWLLWRSATRFENWRDRSFPVRLLRECAAHGVIGRAAWIDVGITGDRTAVEIGSDQLPTRVFEALPATTGSLQVSVGGRDPHGWVVDIALDPFNPDAGRVAGYNIITVTLAAAAFADDARCDALVRTFRSVNEGGQGEFAFLHPHDRYYQLTSDPYRRPLVFTPMFEGVLWCTYLGPRHLAEFDVGRLGGLVGHTVDRRGDEALFLQVTRHWRDAELPDVEAEMQRMTEVFRSAKRR